jgi:hypothetical protein
MAFQQGIILWLSTESCLVAFGASQVFGGEGDLPLSNNPTAHVRP